MLSVRSIPRGKVISENGILWGVGTGRSQNRELALRRAIMQAAEAMSRYAPGTLRDVTLYGHHCEENSQNRQLHVHVILKIPLTSFMFEI